MNREKYGFIITAMSEEPTHSLPDSRSFEERVFARFDALDARMGRMESRLDNVETRLKRLETESQRRAADTKPIWERALAEITAVRQDVAALSKKVDIIEHKLGALASDMLTLRGQQRHIEVRMDNLESKPAS